MGSALVHGAGSARNTERIVKIIRDELKRPPDGYDIPPGDGQRYVALNEVRRLRTRLAAACMVPERDIYKAHLHNSECVQKAIRRNPDRHWAKYGYQIGRSADVEEERMGKKDELLSITAASHYTAVEAGMLPGGILRNEFCSTPRRSRADAEAEEKEIAQRAAEAKARSDAFHSLSDEEKQKARAEKLMRRMISQRLAACFTTWCESVAEIKNSRFVHYAIYVRRAILILPSVPKGNSNGSKSKLARVLKTKEVGDAHNLRLRDNPPVRPEPNVVSVLIVKQPSEGEDSSDLVKSFPTITLPSCPDKAMRLVRPELKRQWGLDAHVLSYSCDEEQESSERGWRLFEVESHDASWIPERKLPGQKGYSVGERYQSVGDVDTNDMDPHQSARVGNPSLENRRSDINLDSLLPNHGAQWMELDEAIGAGPHDKLDVGPTSRAPQMTSWYEPLEIQYARARQREDAGCIIEEKGIAPVKSRPPWRQLGWWSFALKWIDQSLKKHGWHRDGPLYQVTLTDLHCVLRCATKCNGDVYFSTHSKNSRGSKASTISSFLASHKFWQRQVPFVVASDDKLRWLLTQDIRWRLKVRVEDMDDEEPDDVIYKRKFDEMNLPECSGMYEQTQVWIRCLQAVAECQIDSDFRSTRMKEMKVPTLDHNDILSRWKRLVGFRDGVDELGKKVGGKLIEKLVYKGELRSDQLADLRSLQMLNTLEKWLCRLFVDSRIPPLVLQHEKFRPKHCFVAPRAGPKGIDLFAFTDMATGVLTHPFFAVQRLFDEWPGSFKYDDGMFLTSANQSKDKDLSAIESRTGTRASTQRDRRLLRDNYLKCWKRWEPATVARKDFVLARKLWPIIEACRMEIEFEEIIADADRAHQQHSLLLEAAPTLRSCAALAAEILAGLHEDLLSKSESKRSALRPVRAWEEGIVNLVSDNGSFEAKAKVSSDIDVRTLLWRYLELAPTKYVREETDLKSPRVRDTYVALDVPLHTCGIRDGDTLTFRIVKLPPVVKVSLTDELGRLKDTFKGTNNWCPDLPKVDVYTPGSTGYAYMTPDTLLVDTTVPEESMQKYERDSKAAHYASLHDTAKAGRPRTPTCRDQEGPRYFNQKISDSKNFSVSPVHELEEVRLTRKYKKKSIDRNPLELKSAVDKVELKKRKGLKSTW